MSYNHVVNTVLSRLVPAYFGRVYACQFEDVTSLYIYLGQRIALYRAVHFHGCFREEVKCECMCIYQECHSKESFASFKGTTNPMRPVRSSAKWVDPKRQTLDAVPLLLGVKFVVKLISNTSFVTYVDDTHISTCGLSRGSA